MTYREFREKGLDCEDCPIREADLCPGGCTADFRGNPVEPPCCFIDPQEDLDEWVEQQENLIRRIEDAQDRQIKAADEKEAKRKLAKERNSESKLKVCVETSKIKRLRKEIGAYQCIIGMIEGFGVINDILGDGRRAEARKANIQKIENEITKLRKEIEAIEAIKAQKLKELRKKRSKNL
jgi:hypothetical protein